MTLPQLLSEYDALQKEMRDIIVRKNSDYTGDAEDRFANLTLIETLSRGRITAEMGVLVRITDKLSRAMTLMSRTDEPQVAESLEDTLKDMANYDILLVMLHRRRQLERVENPAPCQKGAQFTPPDSACNGYTQTEGSD